MLDARSDVRLIHTHGVICILTSWFGALVRVLGSIRQAPIPLYDVVSSLGKGRLGPQRAWKGYGLLLLVSLVSLAWLALSIAAAVLAPNESRPAEQRHGSPILLLFFLSLLTRNLSVSRSFSDTIDIAREGIEAMKRL